MHGAEGASLYPTDASFGCLSSVLLATRPKDASPYPGDTKRVLTNLVLVESSLRQPHDGLRAPHHLHSLTRTVGAPGLFQPFS